MEDYKDIFQMKLDELLEAGVPLEEAEMQALELMREALAGGYAAGGAVESMNFLKQHLPYQDGGHVALRRKMFKLGGPVNTHGIGITSGLEYRNNYNAGGRVGFAPGGSTVDDLFEKTSKGAKKFGKKGKAVGFGIDSLRKLFGLGKPRGKKITSDIADMVRGPRTAADAGLLMRFAGKPAARALRAGALGTGALAVPGALSAAADKLLPGDYADTEQEAKGSGTERALRALRIGAETGLDFSPLGFGYEALDYLTRDPSVTGGRDLSDFIAGRDRKEIASLDKTGVASKTGMTLDQLKEQNAAENQARIQQAMEQYAELLAGSDDTNKLATLGDALIAGGSALMEGEGYGAAGRAFNEPLSASRRSKEERMAAANASAAQLAISENMQIDAENRAVVNEFMKTGSFTDAEQAQLMALAQQTGGARLIPENEDGEIDENVVNQPGVYADPKNLSGKGSLFIAIDSSGIPIYTNDPQEAKAHAAS